jgi:uncharacterized protein (DUF2225 family)
MIQMQQDEEKAFNILKNIKYWFAALHSALYALQYCHKFVDIILQKNIHMIDSNRLILMFINNLLLDIINKSHRTRYYILDE